MINAKQHILFLTKFVIVTRRSYVRYGKTGVILSKEMQCFPLILTRQMANIAYKLRQLNKINGMVLPRLELATCNLLIQRPQSYLFNIFFPPKKKLVYA